MLSLSALTGKGLDETRLALLALDNVLVMLLERGAADEDEGVDLEELSDAVQDELAPRAQEDAEYHVGAAVARGELVEVVRPKRADEICAGRAVELCIRTQLAEGDRPSRLFVYRSPTALDLRDMNSA